VSPSDQNNFTLTPDLAAKLAKDLRGLAEDARAEVGDLARMRIPSHGSVGKSAEVALGRSHQYTVSSIITLLNGLSGDAERLATAVDNYTATDAVNRTTYESTTSTGGDELCYPDAW
jgi:hypothetical protein